jgi:hypothetical protein
LHGGLDHPLAPIYLGESIVRLIRINGKLAEPDTAIQAMSATTYKQAIVAELEVV